MKQRLLRIALLCSGLTLGGCYETTVVIGSGPPTEVGVTDASGADASLADATPRRDAAARDGFTSEIEIFPFFDAGPPTAMGCVERRAPVTIQPAFGPVDLIGTTYSGEVPYFLLAAPVNEGTVTVFSFWVDQVTPEPNGVSLSFPLTDDRVWAPSTQVTLTREPSDTLVNLVAAAPVAVGSPPSLGSDSWQRYDFATLRTHTFASFGFVFDRFVSTRAAFTPNQSSLAALRYGFAPGEPFGGRALRPSLVEFSDEGQVIEDRPIGDDALAIDVPVVLRAPTGEVCAMWVGRRAGRLAVNGNCSILAPETSATDTEGACEVDRLEATYLRDGRIAYVMRCDGRTSLVIADQDGARRPIAISPRTEGAEAFSMVELQNGLVVVAQVRPDERDRLEVFLVDVDAGSSQLVASDTLFRELRWGRRSVAVAAIDDVLAVAAAHDGGVDVRRFDCTR